MNKILILFIIFLLIIPNFYNSASSDINSSSKLENNKIQSPNNVIVTKHTFDIANNSFQLKNLNIPANTTYPLTTDDSAILSQNQDLLIYYSDNFYSTKQMLVIRNETTNKTEYLDILLNMSCNGGCSWGNSWIPNMFEINNVVYFSGQNGFVAYNISDHTLKDLHPPNIIDFRISSMIPDPNNQVIYMVAVNPQKSWNESFFETYNISSNQFSNISLTNQSYFWSDSLPAMTLNQQDNSVYFLILNAITQFQIYKYSIQNKTIQPIDIHDYEPLDATIFFDNHSSRYFYGSNVYDKNFTFISQLNLPNCFEKVKIDNGSSLFCISNSGSINIINTDTLQTRLIYQSNTTLGHVFYDAKRDQMLIIEPNTLYSLNLSYFKTDLFSPLVNYVIENNTISLAISDTSNGSFTVYENSISISNGLIYPEIESKESIQYSESSKNITIFAQDSNGYWTQIQFEFGSFNPISQSSAISSSSSTHILSTSLPSFEFSMALISLLITLPLRLRKRK